MINLKTLSSLTALMVLMSPSLATQTDNQPILFDDLALECAPHVAAPTLQAIARTESGFNPYAIGVVRGSVKQPTTFAEAVETAKALHEAGKNFSMGLAQINRYNLSKYGLTYESVFDPCLNLKVGADILAECYTRAPGSDQEALQKALSCYYSGNFRTGFTQDLKNQPSYVERIVNNALRNTPTQTIKIKDEEKLKVVAQTVPAINTTAPIATVAVRKTPNKIVSVKKVAAVEQPTQPKESSPKAAASWDAFGEW